MKTEETAKSISDLIDYYCMRCVVGLSNCKISALECARIREDIDFQEAQGDVVVSNPPFSKRDHIFEKLFQMDIAFALVMNFNGLFDSRKRAEVFRKNGVEILVPKGRMKFEHKDRGVLNSPNFQSVYVCHNILDKQIVFSDAKY